MTHKGLRGLVGGVAISLGFAPGCGGTVDLKTNAGEIDGGRGDGSSGDGGSGAEPQEDTKSGGAGRPSGKAGQTGDAGTGGGVSTAGPGGGVSPRFSAASTERAFS